jgi:hypothetical protein
MSDLKCLKGKENALAVSLGSFVGPRTAGARRCRKVKKKQHVRSTFCHCVDDGLEREFKLFNRLEGGVCAMCAPRDQRKSRDSKLKLQRMRARGDGSAMFIRAQRALIFLTRCFSVSAIFPHREDAMLSEV